MRGNWLVGLLFLATAAAAQGTGVPLPTRKSTILRKEGVVYFVEGRQKIPRGCEISIQKDVKIVGRGNAVLEVEGSLQIHGVDRREVIIENLWIEPSKNCEDIHLDMVFFRKGGGVRAPRRLDARAEIFIENVSFEAHTSFEVALNGGRIDLSASSFSERTRIEGIIGERKKFCPLVVNIRSNCTFGSTLEVIDAKDVTVRLCTLRGDKALFKDCLTVMFDGNKVQAATLQFEQTKSGRMPKTKLLKCDLYSSKIIFKVPAAKKEGVRIDKCWFNGLTKAKEIREQVLVEENVRVKFGKIKKRPLELAGQLER